MTQKDWILLLVPILSNGILIYFFQNFIKSKLDHLSKRNSLRDEIFRLFWKKLQELNDIFIQANLNVMNNPDIILEELTAIKNAIYSLVKFYDTNQYDLKIFSKEFNKFQDSWSQFVSKYNIMCDKELTPQEKIILGESLQIVKDNVQNIIQILREKY